MIRKRHTRHEEDLLVPCISSKKNPRTTKSGPGIPLFNPRSCTRNALVREGAVPYAHVPGQVFWLPDQPTCRAFPSTRTVARCSVRSRSQRRARDGFAPSSLFSPAGHPDGLCSFSEKGFQQFCKVEHITAPARCQEQLCEGAESGFQTLNSRGRGCGTRGEARRFCIARTGRA
jgi:hypothetical protein